MAERKKVGDLLKEAGLIDDFQLEAALSHQRNWGGKLGLKWSREALQPGLSTKQSRLNCRAWLL